MTDTPTTRVAYMADSESGLDITGKRMIEIRIEIARPLLDGPHVTRLFGPDGELYGRVSDDASVPTPIAADNINFLVDADDAGRYVFLGQVRGNISYLARDFYYDTKYGDILSVPELGMFDNDTNAEMLSNNRVIVAGEVYGYYTQKTENRPNLQFDPHTSLAPKVVTPQRSATSKLVTGTFIGLDVPRNIISARAYGTADITVTSDAVRHLQIVEFTFATTPTLQSRTYSFVQTKPSHSSIMPYRNFPNTGNLYLPIFY